MLAIVMSYKGIPPNFWRSISTDVAIPPQTAPRSMTVTWKFGFGVAESASAALIPAAPAPMITILLAMMLKRKIEKQLEVEGTNRTAS